MGKRKNGKKKSDDKNRLQTLVLITAIIELIAALVELFHKME